jgi:phosphoglycerate kinase
MTELYETYAGIRPLAALPIEGRRVFVRADFDASEGLGEQRLRLALPTLEAARSRGARLIVGSALETAGPSRAPREIEPVALRLAELLGSEIFVPDESAGDAAKKIVHELRPGQVCVLENLASCPEELENDRAFAERLAAFADVYVNDAFAASNRPSASLDALPRLVHERGMGIWFEQELRALDRIRTPERPFFALLGGEADRQNLELLDALLTRADAIGLGGAFGDTVFAARGADPGNVPVNSELFAEIRAWLGRARDRKLELSFDRGPEASARFREQAERARTILWCGALAGDPGGDRLDNLDFARFLANAGSARLVVDGPLISTLAAAEEDLVSKIGFVSTGGRASLEYIEGRRLPGIETLRGGGT